jgi:uncharacterized protein
MEPHQLKFRVLDGSYAVTRHAAAAPVPDWATKGEFTSITRTAEELSIVCPLENCPAGASQIKRWTCLKLEGPFEFSLTGVLLSFIRPLSENPVPIFALSTYDTDYVLIPEELKSDAIALLQKAGHTCRQ